MAVLGREEYLDRWQQLHGGYDPRASRLVGTWLHGAHAIAAPVARAGVAPDVVTLVGLLVSVAVLPFAVLGGRWLLAAAALVGLSALADSLDGAVAVVAGRVTRWGALLDSLVDRISDVVLVAALWCVGAPLAACLLACVLLLTHEYARARAAAVGLTDIGVVTVGERPTRVAVVAMFLLAGGVLVEPAAAWATAGSYLLVLVGVVALVQLLVVARRRLR